MVRFEYTSKECYQSVVTIDSTGDFQEVYEPISSPSIQTYLSTLEEMNHPLPLFNPNQLERRKLWAKMMPFVGNLTERVYLPTGVLEMFHILKSCFGKHQLILSDFSGLPDATKGLNAPVVQTRYVNSFEYLFLIWVVGTRGR